MQNRIATPMDDAKMAIHAAQQFGIAWSPEQLVRLEHDWRQLQRNFAYHPFVRVVPIHGNPPAEYTVEFRARTVYVRDDGQLDYTMTPAVHVWLPPGYPHEAPIVRPVQAIFHPNVTMEGIWVNPPWDAARTLAQLVQQVGAALAYHTYDPWNVWNPAAMDWAAANGAYLPTDPAANFAPNAGGEPLGRICQQGQKTIEELRGQMQALCASLVAADEPPPPDDVRQFAGRTRLAAHLFLDDDVPDTLRAPAAQVDEWAEALPGAIAYFEGLRLRHAAAAAALQAAGKVAESRRALLKELASLEEMSPGRPAPDPRQALAQLPDLPRMQAAHAAFKVVATEAERRLAAARQRLDGLTPPEPRTAQSHAEELERVLEADLGRAAWAVQDAREKVEAAIANLVPTAERARDELAAFERVIAWRELADLSATGRALVARAVEWGSAGVQAYFVENEGGAFGPFEFEQRLDLGESALAVRNTGRTSVDVYDVTSGSKIARGDAGTATVRLPGGEPGVAYETTFRMTARCDDLWVQVEYLTRQVGGLLSRLSKPAAAATVGRAEAWPRAFDTVLSSPAAVARAVDEARREMLERDSLVSDLKRLARFKERMTTQFLMERHYEMVPRFRQRLAEAEAELADAHARIAAVFARSQRDVETDRPMIPPRLAKEYEQQTRRRDAAQREIDRMHRRFAKAVSQIKPRLTSPTLYGSPTVPKPVVLPPLPAELLERAELLDEVSMGQLVKGLEMQLGVELRPPRSTPPEVETWEQQAPAGAGEMAAEGTAVARDTLIGLAGEGGKDDTIFGGSPAAGTEGRAAPPAVAEVAEDAEVAEPETGSSPDVTPASAEAFVVQDEEAGGQDAVADDWVDLGGGGQGAGGRPVA